MPMKLIFILGLPLVLIGCAKITIAPSATDADRQFEQLSREYLAGYLAWRPQSGTSLGFHEYDGKLTDFSRESLERELNRLKNFDQRFATVNSNALGRGAFYDLRILQAAIK